jgi:hypothetical protein
MKRVFGSRVGEACFRRIIEPGLPPVNLFALFENKVRLVTVLSLGWAGGLVTGVRG